MLFGRYCYDSSCKQIAPEAVFDFNPNKVPLEILQQVIARLRGPALIVELVRFDIAFDSPCKREAVTLVQDQRRSYRLFREKGAITEYQGARSSHGSLKLYDKTKESAFLVTSLAARSPLRANILVLFLSFFQEYTALIYCN